MGQGSPRVNALDLHQTKIWLEISDKEQAWNRVIGARIRRLRESKVLAARGKDLGPRRGPYSGWKNSAANFSQTAFAERLGFTQSWLAKIERGNRAITVFEAHYIAEGLGVDPAEILGPLSPEESDLMNERMAELQRERRRKKITVEQLAVDRANTLNRRRRSTPRTPQEDARVAAGRRVVKSRSRDTKR